MATTGRYPVNRIAAQLPRTGASSDLCVAVQQGLGRDTIKGFVVFIFEKKRVCLFMFRLRI